MEPDEWSVSHFRLLQADALRKCRNSANHAPEMNLRQRNGLVTQTFSNSMVSLVLESECAPQPLGLFDRT